MNATQPKERPILLNGEMVRAVREKRKTQTRRPIIPQPFDMEGTHMEYRESLGGWTHAEASDWAVEDGEPNHHLWRCPFGQPGDLLWVRETWSHPEAGRCNPVHMTRGMEVSYRADGGEPSGERWLPSIHMPRWAARIFLRVVDVRVERVQDISEADARDEGMSGCACGDLYEQGVRFCGRCGKRPPSESFRETWNNIYSAKGYGWDANPFVWVVTFAQEASAE